MSVNQPSPDSNEEELKKREAENAMRQRALTFLLDQNARQRLANIRMVKPEISYDRRELSYKLSFIWEIE